MGLAVLDLFSGAGGLSLGLSAAGAEPVAALDIGADELATYGVHSPQAERIQGDIAGLEAARFRGQVELICGGPPCQPYSSGGLRRGAADARDGLPGFLRVVAEVQPRALLLENVPGLAVGARRAQLEGILAAIAELGYEPSWRVLNAADYGVPQLRRRLFVVGLRGRRFAFPPPSHGPGAGQPHVPAGAVLSAEPCGEPNRARVIYARRPDLRPSPYHGHLFNGGGRPIDLRRPAPTILASAGGNKTHFLDLRGEVPRYHAALRAGAAPREGELPGARRLTTEESARLQGFPAGLRFAGSQSAQYRQIGNAVPPRLARILGEALIAQARR